MKRIYEADKSKYDHERENKLRAKEYYEVLEANLLKAFDKELLRIKDKIAKDSEKLNYKYYIDMKKQYPEYDVSWELENYILENDSTYFIPIMQELLVEASEKFANKLDGEILTPMYRSFEFKI